MDRGFQSLSGCYPAQWGIKNSSCGVNMVLWSAFKPCFFFSERVHFRSYRLISRSCTVQKVSFTLYTLTVGYYFYTRYDKVQAADMLCSFQNRTGPHVCNPVNTGASKSLSAVVPRPPFWGLGIRFLANSHLHSCREVHILNNTQLMQFSRLAYSKHLYKTSGWRV